MKKTQQSGFWWVPTKGLQATERMGKIGPARALGHISQFHTLAADRNAGRQYGDMVVLSRRPKFEGGNPDTESVGDLFGIKRNNGRVRHFNLSFSSLDRRAIR